MDSNNSGSKMTFEALQDPLHCSQCEELGEISFATLQRVHMHTPARVWIKNLPKGISEAGLKNLFLTVGKPISISFDVSKNTALVYFSSIKEAELAVRDLHCKPPYNLKVSMGGQKFQSAIEKKIQEYKKSDSRWDFSTEEKPVEIAEEEDTKYKIDQEISQMKSIITKLGYDPSLRMRQNKLDFETGSDSISLGRGYLFMGTSDRFVGGLQKFESASENSKAKVQMNFFCENCKALTTKYCWNCSVPFCSKICLYKSRDNHQKNCLDSRASDVQSPLESYCLESEVDYQSAASVSSDRLKIPLKIGCNVIISTYLSMNTVFLRRSEEVFEEKFTKLCNDVASEALKGEKLEKQPKMGDLVIGRYYQDLCFYRAQVSSDSKEKIKLFFIDFGNSQETSLEDIRPLPDYLKAVPDFAVKVKLKDIPDGSSLESVSYLNNLTAKRVPLIFDSEDSAGEIVLTERDLGEVVNETVSKFLMPSWRKDESAYSKIGEVFYLTSMVQQKLEIGKKFNLTITHFDEKEFLELEVFWVTNPETDNFFHVNSEMCVKIYEYCEFLKNDYYLPRINELCLAKENGKWHRCVNLKSHRTTCYLFFLDDGHSSLINTNNIRKMIEDFTEAPSQVVCCTLPNDPKLKANEVVQSKVVQFLKESVGQTINSVFVSKLMGDAYCLSIPEIQKILSEVESSASKGKKNFKSGMVIRSRFRL